MLTEAGLPTEGVDPILEYFKVIRDDGGRVIAAGVIEWHQGGDSAGRDGLLRSVVVDDAWRGKGLGGQLIRSFMDTTMEDLYLLTESATDFFRHLGFESIDRSLAPDAVRQSEEFRCLCGESAAFMRRSVDPKTN